MKHNNKFFRPSALITGVFLVLAGTLFVSAAAFATTVGSSITTDGLTITQPVMASLTASTTFPSVYFNLSNTKTWATGALASQFDFSVAASTYAFNGASTVTVAGTINIDRPPRAGTNATITTAGTLVLGSPSADANVTNSSHLTILPLGIRNGYGAMTGLTGIYIADVPGLGISLGDQTATLTNLNSVRLEAITYTSTTNVRTVTNPATLYIAGAPVAGTNVTFDPAGSGALALWVDAGTSRFDGAIAQTQAVATSGSPTALTVTGGAHTTLASAEATDVNFNLTRTVQFATGALSTQRAMKIGQPTYGFAGASTLSNAYTVEIAGPPRAGTNATITTSAALVIGTGNSTNPVDTTNATMMLLKMPDIANNIGAMTNLIGFQLSSDTAQLGNQTAALNFFAGMHLLGVTLTSDTNVRTVTKATTLTVAGPPVASTNVTITGPSRAVEIGGGAVTTGTAQELLVSTGAHTGMTASTAIEGIKFDLSATKQWATGDITAQQEFRIDAPTYGFVGASVITNAQTMFVNRPPRAGTNATLTIASSFQFGGAGADANATNAAHISILPLAIRNGYGAMTTLAGLVYTDGGAGVSLGNQTATLTNLNAIRLDAITYTSTTLVRTVTNPATLYVGGAPVAGANVTFDPAGSGALALWVDAGTSRFDGRVIKSQGADLASANDLTLGTDGNAFEITGTIQINHISSVGWQNGSVVTLAFNENVTVDHANATSGTNITILLSGSADFSATANDTLTLILTETTAGGQAWRELARTAI